MNDSQDAINCLKNLIQIMFCDGRIERKERRFLSLAASELGFEVRDWDAMFNAVLGDTTAIYPIENYEKAIATLKALIVMTKADNHVDETEREYIRDFARTIEITKEDWQTLLDEVETEDVFAPF